MARELQEMLGYKSWQKFDNVIEIGRENLDAAIGDTTKHVIPTGKLPTARVPVPLQDYKLSRLACYHITLACDSRNKPEVKAAKHYFAMKTREAEIFIPEQDRIIKELQLRLAVSTMENKNLELTDKIQGRQDFRMKAYGLPTLLLLEGKGDSVVEVEKFVLEVVDPRSNSSYKGQTLVQINDHLIKTTGKGFKNGAAIKKRLEQLGEEGLIAKAPRTVLGDYVPIENLDAVYCKV
jgi:DNA-damage-inducible protein D